MVDFDVPLNIHLHGCMVFHAIASIYLGCWRYCTYNYYVDVVQGAWRAPAVFSTQFPLRVGRVDCASEG